MNITLTKRVVLYRLQEKSNYLKISSTFTNTNEYKKAVEMIYKERLAGCMELSQEDKEYLSKYSGYSYGLVPKVNYFKEHLHVEELIDFFEASTKDEVEVSFEVYSKYIK